MYLYYIGYLISGQSVWLGSSPVFCYKSVNNYNNTWIIRKNKTIGTKKRKSEGTASGSSGAALKAGCSGLGDGMEGKDVIFPQFQGWLQNFFSRFLWDEMEKNPTESWGKGNVLSWYFCIDSGIFFAKILSRLSKPCGQIERNALLYVME